eukprot:6208185-Pleurochrysis_carterae.AAC.2
MRSPSTIHKESMYHKLHNNLVRKLPAKADLQQRQPKPDIRPRGLNHSVATSIQIDCTVRQVQGAPRSCPGARCRD